MGTIYLNKLIETKFNFFFPKNFIVKSPTIKNRMQRDKDIRIVLEERIIKLKYAVVNKTSNNAFAILFFNLKNEIIAKGILKAIEHAVMFLFG